MIKDRGVGSSKEKPKGANPMGLEDGLTDMEKGWKDNGRRDYSMARRSLTMIRAMSSLRPERAKSTATGSGIQSKGTTLGASMRMGEGRAG